MTKKLLSIVLSVSMILSLCTGLVVVKADAAPVVTTNNLLFDDASMTTYGTSSNANATVEVADGYLKYTQDPTGSSSADTFTIPLEEGKAIDTTKGTFTIEVRAKLPNTGAGNNGQMRSFPCLSDGTTTNLFGLSWCNANNSSLANLAVTAGNHSGARWIEERVNGESFTASSPNSGLNNLGSSNGADRYFLSRADAAANFYTYKWEVDPASGTFRFKYRQADTDNWIEPYSEFYMAKGTYSGTTADRYEEPGVFPTGTLPESISQLVLRLPYGSKVQGTYTYEIDYIKTTHTYSPFAVTSAKITDSKTMMITANESIVTTAFENVIDIKDPNGATPDYTVSAGGTANVLEVTFDEDVDFTGDYSLAITNLASTSSSTYSTDTDITVGTTGLFSTSYRTNTNLPFTATEDTVANDNDKLTWTFNRYNSATQYANNFSSLNYNIKDIAVGTDLIEIEFTSKMPAEGALQGFPMLSDGSTAYNFGFDGATTRTGGTTSYHLRQMLLNNIGQVSPGGLGVNQGILGLPRITDLTYGPSGNDTNKFNSYRFTIDPVAMEYRYEYKLEGTDTWVEPYAGYPSYPVAISSLPETLSELKFVINRNEQFEYLSAASLEFKDISVRTVANTAKFAGKIIDRDYTVDSTDPENVTVTADITANIVNYGEAMNAKVILAMYDGTTKKLIGCKVLADRSFANGINQVIFEDVESTANAVLNDGKTAVTNDSGRIFKLYVWSADGNITPLAKVNAI